MNIIFVENRYRTLFWRRVADALVRDGHNVAFITQNKNFRSWGFKEYVIPYPGKDIESLNFPIERFSEQIKSDRNINYFKHKGSAHYSYYASEIESILDDFKPEIVFGESTAFHELITIELCKQRRVLYLQPSTVRYPTGRFSFYKYDTLEPYLGSKENLDEKKADLIIKSIITRKVIPDVMRKPKVSLDSKIHRLMELISLTTSYFEGEHFNTPSPLVKREIENRKNKLRKKWDTLAFSQTENVKTKFKVLYPMHMQPEANLDVWGRKHRDQLETIRALVKYTDSDVEIVIKPNPKSKYELTEELISFIQKNERCRFVAHNVSMGETLAKVDAVVTVTGTVAIECILANKPVLTLVKTLNNTNNNCIYLDDIAEIGKWIERIKMNQFPSIDDKGKRDFINLLMKTSYVGKPYQTDLDDKNLNNCILGFRDVISKHSAKSVD